MNETFDKECSPLLLNASKAARLLGVGRSTFYELLSERQIGPEPVTLGSRSFWERGALEAWVEAGCPSREQWLSEEIEQGVRAMRIWKPTYRSKKTGQLKHVAKHWVQLKDHKGKVVRFPASENKEMAEIIGRKIQRLACHRAAVEPPDVDLIKWIEQIPERLRSRLVEADLIEKHRAESVKSLHDHLDDFKQSLSDKGNTRQQVNQVVSRVKTIINNSGFKTWSDVTPSAVQRCLANLRDNGKGISAQTSNFYLPAIKQFEKWLLADRRIQETRIEYLKGLNVRTDRRHDRRSLEPDELRRLLEVTNRATKRYGMTGPERALLYRFAAESGLRANEIRSLEVGSFDFENMVVNVTAGYSKRRQEDGVPIRTDTADILKQHFANKHPKTKAFGGTYKQLTKRTSDMIKTDLADAGIDYVDDAGRYADFHSLRHSTGSLLAAAGVHPKTAQTILRHSKVDLTLSRYTHTFRGQASEAVAKLPDLSLPSREKQKETKTGTDDVDFTRSDLPLYLPTEGPKRSISQTNMDRIGHDRTVHGSNSGGRKSGFKG